MLKRKLFNPEEMKDLIREEPGVSHQAEAAKDEIIPVIEEEVIIGKKITEKGSIVIEKKINTEEVAVEVPLMSEHLEINRVAINRIIDSPPEIRYEGNKIIIPVIKEVMVKKLLLVEEIHIDKHEHTINKTENVTVRREDITITRKEK